MTNTVGTPAYIGQVQKMDTSTPAYGPTFDAIHQQLLNNDAFLNSEILGMLQKAVNSGVIDFASITTNLTSNLNAFKIAKGSALVNGILNILTNYGGMSDGTNLIQLDTPPTANVSPSLPGSARDDLVFLEFWFTAITGAPAFRLRYVDAVDFASLPEGLGRGQTASLPATYPATAQGGNSSPIADDGFGSGTTARFYSALDRAGTGVAGKQVALTDMGLYIAGVGTTASQTALNTFDGYSYAIPLFRVRRRNNAGFDPDNNPMGAQDFATATSDLNAAYNPLPAQLNVGSSITINMTSVLPSSFTLGKTLYRVSGSLMIGTITAINGTQLTVTSLNTISSGTSLANNQFYVNADRPDALYSNIIDASDITDLRHQISLTGFNYQALLEKNLDMLLRGQLTTSAGARYGRDYIGLNISAGMPDDANTLLRCDFNSGSMNGTANGTAVTATKQGVGTDNFGNGIQGLGWQGSPTHNVSYSYPVALNQAQGAMELFIKNPWLPNAASNACGLFTVLDGSGTAIAYAGLTADYGIYVNYRKLDGTYGSINTASVFNGKNGLSSIDNIWRKLKIEWDVNGTYFYLDDVLVYTSSTNIFSASGLTPATFILGVWNNSPAGMSFSGAMDAVRISNIRRSATLPSNYSFANGDKILDGPGGDFSQWSDDLGGMTGAGGRSNPFGLSRVPNAMAARVNVNGQEIRHYFGNGFTPGWTGASGGISPTGALESYSAEYQLVNANEAADGTRTSFTFNNPTIALWTLYSSFNSTFKVAGTYSAVSSITLNPVTGQISATFVSAPTSGAFVQAVFSTAGRHAHFIPSTKGFIIHDWTDDSLTADGVNKVFQTSKYGVNIINHVRTAPTATPNIQSVQNGGYATVGLNAQTTLNANAAQNATTIKTNTLPTNSIFSGQNLRISDGKGGWVYTVTTGSAINNGDGTYNIPVSALPAAVSVGATLQGTAQVTFTATPAAGTVDLVYESVYTPALGDYIRILYQHVPYQGTIAANDSYTILAESNAIVTSLGTGAVNTGPYSGNAGMTAATTNLPTAVTDSMLKNDAFIGTTRSTIAGKQLIQSTWDDVPYSNTNPYRSKRVGSAAIVTSPTQALRGISSNSISSSGSPSIGYLYSEQISASVPTKAIWAGLVKDQNGILRLLVMVRQQASNQPQIDFTLGTVTAMDAFHIQGRPLIKNYGGVAA